MKKVLFIFTFILAGIYGGGLCSAQGINVKTEFVYELKFGRVSKACRGFGICLIGMIIVHFEERQAILTDYKGKLCLLVPFPLADEFPEQFSQSKFIMEEDFKFPDEVIEEAKLESDFTLKEGVYQMDRTQKGYRIYLE
jgi:hypothetical protein